MAQVEDEKKFEMSGLRELQYCFRVEFEKNRESCKIIMSQRRYIEKVRKHFIMKKCKLVVISFDVNSKLLKFLDEEFVWKAFHTKQH